MEHEAPPPIIVGIDDWAWRRNHRYGTLVCDLERRATIALLPDREPATVEAWLAQQSQICVVAGDRGGGYAAAAQWALPHAIQVADRWHLMANASGAFLDAVRKSMRQIRTAMAATVIDPSLLTFAEKLQYEGYVRREETNAAILSLFDQGIAIKEIVRRTGHSRGLIRKILRGQRSDVFRVRQSSLEPYLPWLDEQWEAGCRNGAALWRALRLRGFRGCLRIVSEWSARRKQAEKGDTTALSRAPPARTVARLLTVGPERLSKAETITVMAIESGVAVLVEAREIVLDSRASFAERRSRSLTSGSAKRGSASSPRSPTAFQGQAAIEAAIACHGPTGRPKVKYASLSSSNARCTAAETSTCSKLASWASRRRRLHRNCVKAQNCTPIDTLNSYAHGCSPTTYALTTQREPDPRKVRQTHPRWPPTEGLN